VKVWSATVMVAERAPLFVDAAANCTVPPPEPVAPDVIVSHASLLVAVQAQPAPAATSKLELPPDAAMFVEVGAIENAQPLPWFTVNVWPPTVSVPERGPPVIAAALNPTFPGPDPLPPDVMVSQEALLVAVQAQPADVAS
jgi:hypothetical protein